MTTISAKVIADSISHHAPRITTLHLHYPRCIHSEFMTHRVFSRNAGSSRAIPIERQIASVMEDPFIPLHWGAAQSGMQADHECDNPVLWPHPLFGFPDQEVNRLDAWLDARDHAVKVARAFLKGGYAKQVVNRLIEPFAHIDVVVTATEWDNFFKLRDHKDAEPHIAMLAREIKRVMENSKPEPLDDGCWHLPYVMNEEMESIDNIEKLLLISTARCARVSYKPFEGGGSIEKDIELATKLGKSGHWSPFEHQAKPDFKLEHRGPNYNSPWCNERYHGNFVGWQQNRRFAELSP